MHNKCSLYANISRYYPHPQRLSQKRVRQQKQKLPQANRPSIVWNEMKDMEESVVPEALFLCRAQSCFIRLFHDPLKKLIQKNCWWNYGMS